MNIIVDSCKEHLSPAMCVYSLDRGVLNAVTVTMVSMFIEHITRKSDSQYDLNMFRIYIKTNLKPSL